jgi:NAD(P)-dependent dehydrogenase (short-subunit alcohol dehydrogenase family)
MSGRLSDKVCVVTGTGGSMGRATAQTFAREGASIVGCDLSVEAAQATVKMVRGAGGEMVSMQPSHLSEPADCQALVELALSTFGRIDVLFNLAAMSYFNWLEDVTDEEWAHARRDEVDLVFYLTRAAWPHLKAFSDMHRELYDIYVSGDVVVVQLALQGTHDGALHLPFGMLPPTGKRMDAPCCDVFKLAGGKLHRFDCYPEGSVILSQLGVLGNLDAVLQPHVSV